MWETAVPVEKCKCNAVGSFVYMTLQGQYTGLEKTFFFHSALMGKIQIVIPKVCITSSRAVKENQ